MRQPKRSRIVGDNPGRSKASFDPTSRHLASGKRPALPADNTSPHGLPTAIANLHSTCELSAAQLAEHCHHRLSTLDNLCYLLPRPTGPCCHLPGYHTAQTHCTLPAGPSRSVVVRNKTDKHTIYKSNSVPAYTKIK